VRGSCPTDEGLGLRLWSEAAGTALLVMGALSAVAAVMGAGSPLATALPSSSARLAVTGILVATVVALIAASPLGRISGAHLNPAVTLAFRLIGRIGNHVLAGYAAAQAAGAFAGAVLFRAAWRHAARSVGGGVTHPGVSPVAAMALEAAATAALVVTILAFASSARRARFTPLAIWPVLALIIWRLSPDTGSSLNPARSAGPAAAFGDFADLWLYVVGPLAGAAVAALPWALHTARHADPAAA
jgi:aquaporin Z